MTGQATTGNLVTRDIDHGVAPLTWNRPERRNAWTVTMEQEYFALLGARQTRPQDRAPFSFPATVPKPMIAAINGACAGATAQVRAVGRVSADREPHAG